MLQAAGLMGGSPRSSSPSPTSDIARILYVSSEESAEQVRMRAARLGAAAAPNLFVLADTNLARIVEQTRQVAPSVLVIDSVQMIYKADLDAAPGSVAQLRRCAAELVYLAKLSGIAVVLVGHVTKEGRLAGPRLLEHLVDAVLYFEGDRYHAHRILRGVKNRFGTTLEIGIFEMTGTGLTEVPGGLGVGVLDGDSTSREAKIGAVVCPVMTGTRCVLVELQALTATGFIGAAKRKSSGLDSNRLAMLIAVLEQHAGLRLADRDVFASSVGGLRIAEPAADLPLLLAIAGAHHKRAIAPGTAAVGVVGLGGEVRSVTQLEQRLREAGRLGFSRVLIPASQKAIKAKGVQTVPVKTISQAIEELG
jgi:DNA repair protein RadA/Sms